jgi:hypothetical protein
VRGAGHGTRGPLLSRGILAMSCLPELARLAFSWITRAFAAGQVVMAASAILGAPW